jgi:carbonic anhydrase/acetyltransferase-like protein (isoleucine patch superfamily)
MVQYYRLLGAKIGCDVCLYPWGASPGMTEPDLVTLGDRVNVEDVALVCHTNTMGRLELSTVHVGDDSSLRDFCRLQGGAEMSSNSTLMEHSLVMSGEVVPEGCEWQGWPNRSQRSGAWKS